MNTALPSSAPAFGAAVARQASEWLVLLASGTASQRDRQRWQAWLQKDPAHARAWEHIENVNRQWRAVPSGVALATLGAPSSPRRRDAAKLLGMAFVAGAAGWTAYRTSPWQEWTADHRTGTGERRALALADGTRLVLNSVTAVDIAYGASRRVIRLRAGEVFVTSGGSAEARPLVVQTQQGAIRALGTRFAVRQEDGRTVVSVFEGAVEIMPAAARTGALVLRAGESATFGSTLAGPVTAADDRTTAWTDGLIVAQDRALPEFVAELARHRPGRLVCDEAVGQLRVSGVFRLDDTDGVLAALTDALPVRIRYLTRYWVTVVPA